MSDVERFIRICVDRLDPRVRFRAQNAFQHFDKAALLFPIDREMASFRAITGEEEAAAALFRALQVRKYPNANLLKIRDHGHKRALFALLAAAHQNFSQLRRIELEIDPTIPRIDVGLAIRVAGMPDPPGERLLLKLVEPLGIVHSRAEKDGEPGRTDRFAIELRELAAGRGFSAVKDMVFKEANGRNTLLYASDQALPSSRATETDISARKTKATLAIGLAIAVMQTQDHQPLAVLGIETLLEILGKLPEV